MFSMLHSERGLSIGGLPDICSRGRGKRSRSWFGKGLLEDQHEGSRRKLERSLLRELIYGSESKSEMQREAEMIMDKLCSSNPEGASMRKRILADAIKKKAKFKQRTQNDFPFLPTGRRTPFNCIIAAFTVDLFVQEGDRMGSIGIEKTIQRMEETLPEFGYSEAIDGENRRRMRGYLSRDYRKLRMLLGRKTREAPVDNSWPDFLHQCHEMVRNATFETTIQEWDGLMSWCEPDRDVMSALLPNAKDAGQGCLRAYLLLSGLTRDELATAIGWRAAGPMIGGRDVSTRIIEMWGAA